METDQAIKDFIVRGNSKVFSNMTSSIDRLVDGDYKMNIRANLNESIVKARVNNFLFQFIVEDFDEILCFKVSIALKSAANDRYECLDIAFDRTLDACKFTENIFNSVILGWVFRAIEKHLNFPLKCPYGPGIMELKDVVFQMPRVGKIKNIHGFYCMKVTVFAKTKNWKKAEKVLEISGRGEIT